MLNHSSYLQMTVTDQMGHAVNIPLAPQRIISLVPSQTELLFDLGLGDNIVGVTKFCIHPAEKVKSKTVIGGTKNFHFDTINALQPDLIIGNKEENYQEGILQLKGKYPVWLSDVTKLPEALAMIEQIGQITLTSILAERIIQQIASSLQKVNGYLNIPTAYFIWRNPYLSVGQDTFIHHMMEICGMQNVFAYQQRYPEISEEQLRTVQPKLILLSSEPYPFREKHRKEFQRLCPGALIKLVDGELFSWYGSRLRHSAVYFNEIMKEINRDLVRML